jgi:hypothetical protein
MNVYEITTIINLDKRYKIKKRKDCSKNLGKRLEKKKKKKQPSDGIVTRTLMTRGWA